MEADDLGILKDEKKQYRVVIGLSEFLRRGLAMERKRKVLLLGHAVLLLFELFVVVHAFWEEGWATLRFYTTDSNFLCGIASCWYLFSFPRNEERDNGNVTGRYAMAALLQFIATSCLLVTFTVVLLVLGPENGFAHEFLDGTRAFSHLICPLLSLALFALGDVRAPYRWIVAALFATILYAIPLILLNAVGFVSGPYSFLKIREQSVSTTVFWILIILCGNSFLAWGAISLQRRLRS